MLILLHALKATEKQVDLSLHLVIVTELAIFSVRAPSFFFLSMPNLMLVVSVFATCIGASIYAVFGSGITGWAVLWIWVFNLVSFVVVDAGKIYFRRIIGDAPGDIIVSDELIEVQKKNEVELHQEKKERYSIHREAVMDPADFERPVVEVGGLFNVRNYDGGIRSTQPGARMSSMRGASTPRRYKTVSAPELNW